MGSYGSRFGEAALIIVFTGIGTPLLLEKLDLRKVGTP
jgi:hypothetical protein